MAHASKSAFQLTALALALASIGAQGATPDSWAMNQSGNWAVPANWTAGVPTSNSDVTIAVTGTGANAKTITHDSGNDTINSLVFNGGSTNFSNYLTISNGSSLAVSNGGSNSSEIYVDGGTFSVTGGTLTNTGYLQALSGGAININNATVSGGTIQSVGGGTVTFNGGTMAGGTLMAFGGSIVVGNNSLLDGSANAITNSGPLTLATNVNVFATGSIIDNGGITTQGDGTFLRINGGSSLSLSGTGALTLTGPNVQVYSNDGGGTLANGASHTIQGYGQLGGDRTLLNNAGVITANVSGQILFVDPQNGEGNMINTGTLRAENGGILQLAVGNYTNNNGTIAALAGSTVLLNGAIIEGGQLATAGTGTIIANNNTLLDGSTHNAITNNGTLLLGENQNVFATGSIVDNQGISTQGNSTFLRINGPTSLTLSGTGSLTLTGNNTEVYSNDGGGTLFNSAGYTIKGQGQVGLDRTVLNNAGVVTANVSGQTLVVDPQNGEGNMINTGTLRAENGGILQLAGGNYTNNNGTIAALAGSTVLLNGATIEGGLLTTTGTGTILANNNTLLDGSTHNAITNNGTLLLGENQNVFATGSIVDNHGISTQGNSTFLRIAGSSNLTLSGTGSLTLTSNSTEVFSDAGGGTLFNSAGYTIQGQGQVGLDRTVLNNAGVITANVSGQTLVVDPTSGEGNMLNTGTLRAENGGTLRLDGGNYTNNNGTIAALVGSTVLLNGATIEGGLLTSTGTGTILANNNTTLDGTVHGAITNNSALLLGTNQNIFATGSIVDNGGITVQGDGTFLRIAGSTNLTLSGTGSLTLTGNNTQVFSDAAGGTLFNSAGYTIQGQGQVGLDRTVLNNAGVITANVSGQTLTVDPQNGEGNMINTGTLRAENGGTLQLAIGNYINNGATIEALAGSTVVLNGAIIEGGLLRSTGTGTILANNNTFLDGTLHGAITNNSALQLATNQNIYATGTIVDNGGITVQGDGTFLRIAGSTNLTLSGTGSLTLTGNNTQVFSDAAGGTLTNGAGHTIQGFGQVGANRTELTNASIVNANVMNQTLVVNTLSAVSNQSTGVLQASNGGTLYIDKAVNGTGTIRSDSGGTVQLNQSSTTGNLVNNASLALGTSNITVSGDYSNANFGTGNGFNKKAGVTGTGQILASDGTAQAITGATVTNGTSTTPTITIGNVHVGQGTTYAYQVANPGTGASIRGAIETSVNGGNITDSRLSGSGVTAGNYGPVAAGGKSGNLNVTFTASSAGALAPLSGQAVHVANNFDNVAEQTLSIVTGAGAAAYNLASASVMPAPIVFGNSHVNDVRTQALTVANTGPSGGYTEKLDASFGANTGNVSNNNGMTSVAAQQSNNSALAVTLNTATAGARSGTVTVNLTSDGTGTSGLGNTTLAPQTIAVSGNVYNLASSSTIGAVNFGLHHVGDGTITQNVSVTNTAASGNFSEGLDTSFGAVTGTGSGKITTSGSVTNLAAGATNAAGTLQVSLNTSQAGTVNGNIRVIQASNGTISGLGNTALPDQNPAVTADVEAMGTTVRFANAQINNAPLNFNGVRINTTQNQALSITNAVPNDGFSESLIASVASSSGKATGSGGFGPPSSTPSLAPSATDNSHVIVGLDTTTAGHQTGTVNVNFKSDGTAFAGGTITDQGNTAVNVSGDVYRLANAQLNTPSVTVAARVGTTGPTTGISITNQSPDAFTEGLSVSRGATSAGFTSSGSLTNLTAGATASSIAVALNTTTAGTFTGTQALNYASTGAGTTGAADLSVGSGTVTLNGKVYTQATASSPTAVDFGIVHVGDTVASRGVAVTNTAAVTALNDTLVASAAGATGPFSNSGSLGAGGLAAQQTSANGLQVGLSTTAAGVYSGSATFTAASHDPDLSDAALANIAVSLTGQVNNYATDRFTFGNGAGTLTQTADGFVLDYGTVMQGSGTENTTLYATNSAVGPADVLSGTFEAQDTPDFGESFAAFMNLVAGANSGPLTLAFDTSTIGQFMDTIVLHGVGSNASSYSAAIGDLQLIIRGTVTGQVVTPPGGAVPEPDSLLLLGLGVPLLFVRRRKATQAAR